MTPVMSCESVQDRLSDYRDGALDATERAAVDAHLSAHPDCRRLLETLGELAPLLRSLGGTAEPTAGLAERAALAALREGRPRPLPFRPRPRYRPAVPAPLQAAAAVAMLVAGTAGLVTGPDAAPARAASRIVERTSLELSQQRDRLIEELRELAAVVGTAVETRMDRVEDRVDDYRRLLEEQRQSRPAPTESRAGVPPRRSARRDVEPGAMVTRIRLAGTPPIMASLAAAATSQRRRT